MGSDFRENKSRLSRQEILFLKRPDLSERLKEHV
jgi:hypothetical protein